MTQHKWIATVLLVGFCAVTAYAQTDQGKVSGTVRDQSNAFVSGAKVTVKNERTGEERSTISNDQGYFLINSGDRSAARLCAIAPSFSAVLNATG